MRTCARPGCSSPAAAILTYDREALTAYLFEIDDPATRAPGDLCQRHTARLVLPRGWQLHDRRAAAQEAVAEPAPAEPTPIAKPRTKKLRAVADPASPAKAAHQATPKAPRGKAPRAAARRKWADATTSLFDAPTSDTEKSTAAAEEPSATEPLYMPRFGPDSELDSVPDATTPLLRRAFGGV
jgi:Protein of unknown function (DUF3499)